MTLYLKVLQMMHHPVKRLPIPYIYASINFPLNQEPEYTEKSNAIPPCWNQSTFKFNLSDSDFENGDENSQLLRLTMLESRLFMKEEKLGFCDIYIPSLPKNKILIQWVNLTSCRSYLPPMMCLLMIQLNTDSFSSAFSEETARTLEANLVDNIIFNAPLALPEDILQFEPWDPREIELKYLNQINIQSLMSQLIGSQDGGGDKEEEDNEEESQYKSSLKSVLKMFSQL